MVVTTAPAFPFSPTITLIPFHSTVWVRLPSPCYRRQSRLPPCPCSRASLHSSSGAGTGAKASGTRLEVRRNAEEDVQNRFFAVLVLPSARGYEHFRQTATEL